MKYLYNLNSRGGLPPLPFGNYVGRGLAPAAKNIDVKSGGSKPPPYNIIYLGEIYYGYDIGILPQICGGFGI